MKHFLLSISFLISSFISQSAVINFDLSMPEAHTHYFEVTMNVVDYEKEYFDIQMPVWSPGSYLVREFSKNVEGMKAMSNNKPIKTEQINKNTWRIYSKKAANINISYRVYAFKLSVRTSFVDASHGYLNGTSVFMFIDELKNNPIKLKITPYKGWEKVSTSLPKTKGKGFNYEAPNYDILVDSPIEIGNQVTFDFTSAGTIHHVAMYGKGNYAIEKLKVDMGKVTQAATDVFGENPNKEYTFIIHNLTNGSGGLEHLSSTTLEVNRWTYEGDAYMGFLGLVAHEYFHLWNVKRIRPMALGPFDYNNENYTDLLWVMEGFTSYYSNIILYRAGYYDEDRLTSKVNGSINSIENQPGNKVQSATNASFNAWIKAYRPNENSYNTTISYYTKGSVIASMLDLEIINATNGLKNLDDVLQYLYKEYYKKQGRGFTSEEMRKALETISGLDLSEFFEKYVTGTETFDYEKVLGYANLSVKKTTTESASLGISTSGNKITRVIRGRTAYDGGLNVNDEIIAIDGFRVNSNNLSDFIQSKKTGEDVTILISRDNWMQELTFPIKKSERVRYLIFKASDEDNVVYKKWTSK